MSGERHLIAAIAFRPGLLLCTCGKQLVGATPEDLDSAFYQHRKAMGVGNKRKNGFAYGSGVSPWRGQQVA